MDVRDDPNHQNVRRALTERETIPRIPDRFCQNHRMRHAQYRPDERVGQHLEVIARALSTLRAGGRESQSRFDIVLHLSNQSSDQQHSMTFCEDHHNTFVAFVPPK